jgi:hypothetical protein
LLLGFLAQLLTPTGIASAVAVLLGVVFSLVKLGDRRRAIVATIAHHAFLCVEDLKKQVDNPATLDKVAAGLKAADDYARLQGWRALTDDEKALVKVQFSALNGASTLAPPNGVP